jgi:3-hydroxyisobutyrate dehydrogenase-like beta-hydroxyacid dehydrogenase
MNIVIAIHSPGAMGSAISARLVEHGARVLTSLDGRSAATVERARAAGMEDVSPETITTADLILSILPPGEAVALAEGFVTLLSESRHKPVFIDCNALSPKTKAQVAVTLSETGCDVIDGAIIGAPPLPGEKGPRFYVSGERSGRASVLGSLGLDLRQIDGPIGAAAALKMSYSGISKGLTAIGTAMLLAACRSGSSRALYQELSESLPQFLSRFQTGIPDMYPKAFRWVAEMREIAALLSEDRAATMIFERGANSTIGSLPISRVKGNQHRCGGESGQPHRRSRIRTLPSTNQRGRFGQGVHVSSDFGATA